MSKSKVTFTSWLTGNIVTCVFAYNVACVGEMKEKILSCFHYKPGTYDVLGSREDDDVQTYTYTHKHSNAETKTQAN